MNWFSVDTALPESNGLYLVLKDVVGFLFPSILSFYIDTKKDFWEDEVPPNSKNVFIGESEGINYVCSYVKYWAEIPDYSSLT